MNREPLARRSTHCHEEADVRNTNRWVVWIVMTGILSVAGSARGADEAGRRPMVAIVDFDATPAGSTLPPPQLGSTIAQLLLDKLVGVAPFHLLDGRWLSYRMPTPDRGDMTGLLRENARRAGVDYLIFGSVTRFSNEQRHRTLGGGGFRVPLVGGYRRQTDDIVVSILITVVDVRSGEVVATSTGQGAGRRRKIGLGALRLLRAAGGGGIASGSSSSRDAQLDEAMQQAVTAAAKGLVNASSRIAREARIERESP